MSDAERPAIKGHRIVTLTMNPALDITTSTATVQSTEKLRCSAARYDPGGGGVNVAHVADVLGARAPAILPAGGPAGEMVCNLLVDQGLTIERIKISGATRESISVNELSTDRQYRFVLPGPELSVTEQDKCLRTLRRAAESAAIVVASGSLPPGVPPDFYQQVSNVCAEIGATFMLDTSGGGLKRIESGVFLLKPSLRELRECVDQELGTEAEQFAAALDLVQRGCARHVLVSLGARGALLANHQGGQRFSPVHVPPGSGVGAGDAMVAGVAVGLTRGWPLTKAIQLGVAAGAAALLTPGTAPPTREATERLVAQTQEPAYLDLTPGSHE